MLFDYSRISTEKLRRQNNNSIKLQKQLIPKQSYVKLKRERDLQQGNLSRQIVCKGNELWVFSNQHWVI